MNTSTCCRNNEVTANAKAREACVSTPGRRILVVDDDAQARTSLKRKLAVAGYRVQTSPGGTRAISVVGRYGADLAIVDVKVPSEVGFEVFQAIRRTSDIPVILITALEYETIRPYLSNLVGAVGGDCFLRKPFDVHLLMYRVSEALSRNPLLRPLGRRRMPNSFVGVSVRSAEAGAGPSTMGWQSHESRM